MKKFMDLTTLKFLAVGVVNTLVGTGLMFVLYNIFSVNYWISSASNYIVGSIIMISLGIIGYYIAKIYEEVKGRPRYLISRKLERRAAGKENTEPAGHGKPADD